MKHTENITKKILEYTVVFEQAEEGGYIARVPSLAGCITQGETLKEATKNVADAIEGYLLVLKETGEEVPVEHKTIISKISIANPFALSV